MKRKLCLAAVLLALTLMFFGCGSKPGPSQDTLPLPQTTTEPATEPASTTTTEPAEPPRGEITSETITDTIMQGEHELISISLQTPRIQFLDSANTYYQDWANDMRYYISLEEDTARDSYDTMKSTGGVFVPYSYEAVFTVTRDDELVSIMRELTTYTGGMHPGNEILSETFVRESGALLILDDVFTVPREEYYPVLKQLVLAIIDERHPNDKNELFYANFEDDLMVVFEPDDFYFTDAGLVIYWQEYAIGPYVSGAHEFELKYADLSGIINPIWVK